MTKSRHTNFDTSKQGVRGSIHQQPNPTYSHLAEHAHVYRGDALTTYSPLLYLTPILIPLGRTLGNSKFEQLNAKNGDINLEIGGRDQNIFK